jgi:hypothetical protein
MEIAVVLGFPILMFCAVISCWIAHFRNRSKFGWFVTGFLFGPLAILAVGFLPGRGERDNYRQEDYEPMTDAQYRFRPLSNNAAKR